MKFKWAVNKVTVAENNLIVKVDITVTAIDGDNTAQAAYTRNLVQGDSFIPYDQLTEQQVLDWCFEPEVITFLDLDNVEHSYTKHLKQDGESQTAGQIPRQLAQKAAEPALPWAQIPA